MFIAALFTITKMWKQPKCPPVDELDKKTMGHLNNGILVGHKKEENFTIFDSMNGFGEHMLSQIIQSKNDKYHII